MTTQDAKGRKKYKNTDELLSEITNHENFVDFIGTLSFMDEARIVLRYKKPVAGEMETTTVDIEDCMFSGAVLSAALYLGIKAEV